MSGVELPLENLSYEGVAISEIGVTDEVKQALELLDSFITQYIKEKHLPKDVEIKTIETALDTLLVCIKDEKQKPTENRLEHLDEVAWRASHTLGILAMEKVSAAKCFQNALCYYLAMKKRHDPKTRIKVKSGKIEWTIADDLATTDLPSINRIYQMMQEAHEMAIKEGNEVMITKINSTLALLQGEYRLNMKEWEGRFLDVMVKKLQSQGLGKVYVEGSAIIIRLGDDTYKPRPFHDLPVKEGWMPNELYLQEAIESNIVNAMIEVAGTPPELKISAQITSLSDHLKKVEFSPS